MVFSPTVLLVLSLQDPFLTSQALQLLHVTCRNATWQARSPPDASASRSERVRSSSDASAAESQPQDAHAAAGTLNVIDFRESFEGVRLKSGTPRFAKLAVCMYDRSLFSGSVQRVSVAGDWRSAGGDVGWYRCNLFTPIPSTDFVALFLFGGGKL